MTTSGPGELRPSLRTYLFAFVLITGGIGAYFLVVSGERKVDEIEFAALQEIAERRASAVGELFSRALWHDMRDAIHLGRSVSEMDAGERRAAFDLLAGERITWAGYAGLDGIVVSASKGRHEGASAAQLAWFQRGLEGPFAGDVHDARLLAERATGKNASPSRFLDIAAPAVDQSGAAVGVVGLEVSHAWANAFLTETAEMVGVDALLVDREGQVIVGPEAMIGRTIDIASFGAARTGSSAARVELWPDGRPSLSVVIPTVGYRTLPSLGWSLVARIDRDALADARDRVERSLFLELAGLLIAAMALTFAFSRYFISPFGRIASDAERIVDGEEVYPTEFRRTGEMARLGAAIAHFQAKLSLRS